MKQENSTKSAPEISAIDAYWHKSSNGLKNLAVRIIRKLVFTYRKFLPKRLYVFRSKGPFTEPLPCDYLFCEYEIVRYNVFNDIPDNIKSEISFYGGDESLKIAKFELDHGASFWAILTDGKVASMLFARQGKYFQKWYVSLDDNDVVFFRGWTTPEHRGLGFGPCLGSTMMYQLLGKHGKAYADCNIHNISSMRAMLKSGFEIVGEVRPLSNMQALGSDYK